MSKKSQKSDKLDPDPSKSDPEKFVEISLEDGIGYDTPPPPRPRKESKDSSVPNYQNIMPTRKANERVEAIEMNPLEMSHDMGRKQSVSIKDYAEPPIPLPIPFPNLSPKTSLEDSSHGGQRVLDMLKLTDRVYIKQEVQGGCGVLFRRDTKNEYEVRVTTKLSLIATEENKSPIPRGLLFSPWRPFEINICDISTVINLNASKYKFEDITSQTPMTNVIYLERINTGSIRTFHRSQQVHVFAPPGQKIGMIEKESSIFKPRYSVKNNEGNPLFRIKGPPMTCSLGMDVDFAIFRPESDGNFGDKIGHISKYWSGIRRALTNSDNFGITFPIDLDVTEKALLIGACFLIDFVHFE